MRTLPEADLGSMQVLHNMLYLTCKVHHQKDSASLFEAPPVK